jgi:hypothetical protein
MSIKKSKETRGKMIVVASLLEKLPNFGHLARTSEVNSHF